MPVDVDIKLDQATADAFFAAVDQAQRDLGKSTLASLQWAARLLCESLGAETKKSKPTRKTKMNRGANPMPENRGINKTSTVTFEAYKGGSPITRSLAIVATNKSDGQRYMRKMYLSEKFGRDWLPYNLMDMRNDPRLKIGRSGLAKMAWKRAKANITHGGTGFGKGVPLADVTVTRSFTDPSITLSNKLRYAVDALEGGEGAVNAAMHSATNKLVHEIKRRAAERLAKI